MGQAHAPQRRPSCLARLRRWAPPALSAWLPLIAPAPAAAGELFGGAFVHDIDTPFSLSGQERGLDLHLGWRGGRIEALRFAGRPRPHAYASVNSSGDTSFASAGLSWKVGGRLYLRPGIGVAVHNGPGRGDADPERIRFGSRILFAPEVAAGLQLSKRLSAEAAWVHFSHAQLLGAHNPGTDSFGIRLNYRY